MELDTSSCSYSEIVDGVLRIAVELQGPNGSGKALATMQPLGLIARPRDPNVLPDGSTGDAANAFYGFSGGEGFVMPLLDPRFVSFVPPVKKGGTALYCAAGPILNFDGDDGTAMLLTPTSYGTSYVLTLDAAGDQVVLRHGRGHGISMLGDAKRTFVISSSTGSVGILVNDDQLLLNGNTQVNGSLVVGAVPSALPVALYDAWAAWAAIVTSMVKAISTTYPSAASASEPALDAALAALDMAGKSTVLKASPTPS